MHDRSLRRSHYGTAVKMVSASDKFECTYFRCKSLLSLIRPRYLTGKLFPASLKLTALAKGEGLLIAYVMLFL